VADDPPKALVAHLAETFLKTDGDLLAFTMALLNSDESWTAAMTKIRLPQEFFMAASRAFNLPPKSPQVLRTLQALGQPLWRPPGPDGFGDKQQDWASAEGLKLRLGIADVFSRQSRVEANPSELAKTVLGDTMSADTANAIARAESPSEGLALLLMAPEFQRR
jgi:uncharacterized protein (DUF1800 family)